MRAARPIVLPFKSGGLKMTTLAEACGHDSSELSEVNLIQRFRCDLSMEIGQNISYFRNYCSQSSSGR